MATTSKAPPRIGLEVLVSVIPEGGLPHLGKTTNLSVTGMLLEIRDELEVGTRVQLRLFLPGSRKKISVAGEVIREAGRAEDGFSYGVRFVEIPSETEREIEGLLTARRERPGSRR